MGLHRGYDNRNSRERNKNEIVLTKKSSLTGAPIDQNALRFSQMQYGLLRSISTPNIWNSQKVNFKIAKKAFYEARPQERGPGATNGHTHPCVSNIDQHNQEFS